MTSRQLVVTADGLTHASSVIALVRCREAASGIVTSALMPSNDNPAPYIPVVHVALVMNPVFPVPDASATVVPVPSLNAYAATRPVCAVADATPNSRTTTRTATTRVACRMRLRSFIPRDTEPSSQDALEKETAGA